MADLLLLVGGIALLIVSYVMYQRQREQRLIERLKRAGHEPSAVLGEINAAIGDEKARQEFWRHQNPG
ncbi:MAG: hypothetical protein NT029_16905 [Armatimonadetes bacterium]|nr:hypothetical protein [Armatimonadota bacterium]